MTLKLELPPELEIRLREEAERRGVDVGPYARGLLEKALALRLTPDREDRPFHETATSEEWLREFDDFLASFEDVEVPDFPDEALRREHLYEDRGL